MENILDYIKKHLVVFLLVITNIIFICLAIYFYTLDSAPQYTECEEKEEVKSSKKIFVDVKGSVKSPGVYEVDENDIINNVIDLAGGFSKDAYTKNINLSKKVSDELVIYVYTKNEYKKLNTNEVKTTECTSSSYNISNCVPSSNSVIVSGENDTIINNQDNGNSETKMININTATKDELLNLPGIGESKAKSIISYRTENGNFKTIEDIKNVSGIGDALFEQIKNNITI